MRPHHKRLLLAALTVVLLAPWQSALAQEDTLEVRRQLNDKATAAAEAGDYDRAILLLRSALELGELDITHLNLGRVYFLSGDCEAAARSYEQALKAPSVPGFDPELIRSSVERFSAELETTCEGVLVVTCDDGVTATIENQTEPVCGQQVSLPPGPVRVMGRAGDQTITAEATVEAMKRTTLRVVAPLVPAPVAKSVEREQRDDSSASTPILVTGWTLVGLGAASGLTVALLHVRNQDDVQQLANISGSYPADRRRFDDLRDEVENRELTMWVVGSLGTAAVLTGAGLLWWQLGSETEATAVVGPKGASLAVRF